MPGIKASHVGKCKHQFKLKYYQNVKCKFVRLFVHRHKLSELKKIVISGLVDSTILIDFSLVTLLMPDNESFYISFFAFNNTIYTIFKKCFKYTTRFALTAHNWQKWKRVFLTCPCHKIYRDEAVGLKNCKNTWKTTLFVKMWNLGQYRENLIFCQ